MQVAVYLPAFTSASASSGRIRARALETSTLAAFGGEFWAAADGSHGRYQGVWVDLFQKGGRDSEVYSGAVSADRVLGNVAVPVDGQLLAG